MKMFQYAFCFSEFMLHKINTIHKTSKIKNHNDFKIRTYVNTVRKCMKHTYDLF